MSERLTVLFEDRQICAFELMDGAGQYDEELRRTLRFASKANNITSDEAECRRLNGGEIYYLDEEKKQVKIRRKYHGSMRYEN